MIFGEECDCFSLCLKSLPEAKVKTFTLIELTKEISRQFSMDSVPWLTLMKSVLIKGSKLRKEKCKAYASRVKGAPGNRAELNPVLKEINRLKI